MEAVGVGHHHDPSNGEDGGHDLHRREETAVRGWGAVGRATEVETLRRVSCEGREWGLLSSSLENKWDFCSCLGKLCAMEPLEQLVARRPAVARGHLVAWGHLVARPPWCWETAEKAVMMPTAGALALTKFGRPPWE